MDLLEYYRAPGITLHQKTKNEIFDNIDKNKLTFLMGDFNTYNEIWNCKKPGNSAERLYESLINSNILFHNFDTLTHITPNSCTYFNLDLIFIISYLIFLI